MKTRLKVGVYLAGVVLMLVSFMLLALSASIQEDQVPSCQASVSFCEEGMD